jgi:hypothetical protein
MQERGGTVGNKRALNNTCFHFDLWFRYKQVLAQEQIAKANAKVEVSKNKGHGLMYYTFHQILKKMTAQDREENGVVVAEGWSGKSKKGGKGQTRCFGDPAKLEPKVRLQVCFDKNPQEQKMLVIKRSDGLKVRPSNFDLRLCQPWSWLVSYSY